MSVIGSATHDHLYFSSLAMCKIFNHATNTHNLCSKQCSEVHHALTSLLWPQETVQVAYLYSARDSFGVAILASWSHGWHTNRKFALIRSMSD